MLLINQAQKHNNIWRKQPQSQGGQSHSNTQITNTKLEFHNRKNSDPNFTHSLNNKINPLLYKFQELTMWAHLFNCNHIKNKSPHSQKNKNKKNRIYGPFANLEPTRKKGCKFLSLHSTYNSSSLEGCKFFSAFTQHKNHPRLPSPCALTQCTISSKKQGCKIKLMLNPFNIQSSENCKFLFFCSTYNPVRYCKI